MNASAIQNQDRRHARRGAPDPCRDGPLRCWAAVLWLMLAGACPALDGATETASQPSGFEVRGEVAWDVLAVSPKQWAFEFSARVCGRTWEIRVTPKPGTTARDIRIPEFRAACDGRTLYRVLDFGDKRGEGDVYSSVVPNQEAFFAPIWLAFCSESYFQERSTNRITVPICDNVFSGESVNGLVALEYSQAAFWALASGPPRCPQVLHSLDDGRVKRVRGPRYAITEERYPSPYDKGFTNIVFEASDYDQVGAFRLPRGAELSVYWLRGGRTRLHWLRLTREAAAPLTGPIEFPPRLPGVALVGDWRFTLSNRPMQVTYVATNRFLSREEVEAATPYFSHSLQTWQTVFAQGPLRAAERRRVTWFWMAAGAVTILLAGVFWALRKREPRTVATTTQQETVGGE